MEKLTCRNNIRLAWRYIRDRKRVNTFLSLPEEQIQKYQLKKIKELLNIAYYHTDFYKRKYDAIGIRPEDVQSLEDFKKIPTITKEELITYNEEFIDKRIKKEELICSKSSGSSGLFVDVYLSQDTFIDEELQVLRMLKGFNPNYCSTDKEVLVYTSEYPITSILGFYKVYFINNLLDANEILRLLKEIKPKIVAIYPSILREIIDLSKEISNLGIQTIITNSEHSTQQERDEFAKILGCDVYDEFSSEELQSIFCQCKNKHYHDVPDCTYVELMEEDFDRNVMVGKMGEVVGTCLINKAMPIIRYRSGDLAVQSLHKCSCGYNSKMYEHILGRKNASFKKVDGTQIPSGKILDWSYSLVLKHNIDILEFQIIQESYNEILVQVVAGTQYDENRDNILLVQSFRHYFGKNYYIKVKIIDEIPKTTSGKHIPIISLVNTE